jgi:hypothetical protein
MPRLQAYTIIPGLAFSSQGSLDLSLRGIGKGDIIAYEDW